MNKEKLAHKRLHAVLSGRVQGVFYRAWTQDTARELGLTGWVRNLPDGGVELVAEGPQGSLEKFLERCRRGPPSAQVREVREDWGKAEDEFEDFRITR